MPADCSLAHASGYDFSRAQLHPQSGPREHGFCEAVPPHGASFFFRRNFMNTATWVGAAAIAYLAGSIPFGLLIARYVKGVDIRLHGSHTIGATGVGRVLGGKWGAFVLVLD